MMMIIRNVLAHHDLDSDEYSKAVKLYSNTRGHHYVAATYRLVYQYSAVIGYRPIIVE